MKGEMMARRTLKQKGSTGTGAPASAGVKSQGKGKALGLTATPANSAAKNPNPSPAPSYGGPKSGRPVKSPPPYQGTGSKGKGKGATYGVGLGGTPPSRGGTQIKKAANSKTSGGQVTRKAAKKAYKGKDFKAAWAGYKGRRRRVPNKTAGKPMR